EEDPIDYFFHEAVLGLNKGEIDQAVATCLDNPGQFEDLAKFAALFYKAKRCAEGQKLTWLQQAQAQAEQLLTVEPSDFLAELFLYRLGNSLYKASFLENAIACYDAALDIKPDLHEALYNKGIALDDLGQYEAAIACYDAALDIKPDDHEALYGKGYALDDLGQYEAAIACYDAALAIKPDKHEALMSKGIALGYLERYEAAIACYDAALAIKPDDHNTLYNKACCYGLQGDADNALHTLQSAIALDPKYRAMAKTDTDFDPIRTDDRFQALLEKE
ncbi:MAG: tetratricopeptide repeat protein, partial [Nodosilinea sp.]